MVTPQFNSSKQYDELHATLEHAANEAAERATTQANAIWSEFVAVGKQIEALKHKRNELLQHY